MCAAVTTCVPNARGSTHLRARALHDGHSLLQRRDLADDHLTHGSIRSIRVLAGLCRFIIADITNPKSSPLELQALMPDYMIPFVPIFQENEEPFAMFRDLKQKYGDWVLDVLKYDSVENLVRVLEKAAIYPALEKGKDLLVKKAEAIRVRHVRDFM